MGADSVPYFRPQFLDANGKPLAGGLVYTYKAGTTTPLATYKDANYTPNTNPIVLDGSGCADIFIGIQALKFVIHDANDVLIKTVDQVTGAGGAVVGIQTVVPIVTDGVETTFALGVDAELPQNCTVVVQPTSGDRIVYMTSEYSIDGQNLVFDSVPPAGAGEIRVGSTRAIGSSGLSDGIVTTSKLQNLAVTNAKLADNSVGTSKIQDGAVTLDKMAEDSVDTEQLVDGAVETASIADGAVTNEKKAAIYYVESGSSGNFSTPSSSPADVTNLSVTIDATDKPIYVALISDGSAIGSSVGAQVSTGSSAEAVFFLLRDGSEICRFRQSISASGASSVESHAPASAICFVDFTPGSGSITYKLQASVFTGTRAYVRYAKLVAFVL